ncbi:MAG: matrixin family metalloprotease [Acidobacteriota bacterium]
MKSDKRSHLLLLGSLMTLLVSQSAYVVRTTSKLSRSHWDEQDFPVTLRIWKGFDDSSASIAPGSHPMAALGEALQRWAKASSLTARVVPGSIVAEAGYDGVNLVTIADTPRNRSIVGSALAVTQSWQLGATLVESDIVFNPGYYWSTYQTDESWDLLQVATHELGHAVGLGHSIQRSAVMYYQGGSFGFGPSSLSWDDLAGVNSSYRLVGMEQITGAIAGRVSLDDAPVYGAFVVAVDEEGVLTASTLSMPDGSYQLECLPPGRYTLYAEPLDGPMTPATVNLGSLSTRGMNTDFRPQFYQGSLTPSVGVDRARTTRVEFALSPGSREVDAVWARADEDPDQSGSFSLLPAHLAAGSRAHFGVAGETVSQLDDEAGVFFLGPHLQTSRTSRSVANSEGVDFKWYPLEVSDDAPLGDYSVFVREGNETGVLTGALEVLSAYPFFQGFAPFPRLDGVASLELFLINTDLSGRGDGRLVGLDERGSRIDLESAEGLDFSLDPGALLSLKIGGEADLPGALRAEATRPLAGMVVLEVAGSSTSIVPSPPLHSFVAPIEVRAAGAKINTGLALANFERRPVQVYLQVQDESGAFLASTVLNLPGNGHLFRFVPEWVSGLPADLKGTVTATSNRWIGATVVRTTKGTMTALPVIENRVTGSRFYAQFAQIGDFTSELLLINPSPSVSADNVAVKVRHSDGAVASISLNDEWLTNGLKSVRVPPLGVVSLKTTSPLIGSLEVASDVPVGSVVLFHTPYGTTALNQNPPTRRGVLPIDRDTEAGKDTGIAVVNTEPYQTALSFTVRSANGSVVSGPIQLQLQPWEQLARFPNEVPLGLGLEDDFKGSLWIESDRKLALTAIRQAPGALTTFSVIPLDEDGLPNDPAQP